MGNGQTSKIWVSIWVRGQIWVKGGNFWVNLGEMTGVEKKSVVNA
jgi:hypothetical protein